METLSETRLDGARANVRKYKNALHLLKNGNSLTRVLNFVYYNVNMHKPHFITDTTEIAPAKQWVKVIQNSENDLMNPNVIADDPKYEKEVRACAEKMFVAQARSKSTLYFYADYNIEMMGVPHFILVTKPFLAKRLRYILKVVQTSLAYDKQDVIDERKHKSQAKCY